MKILIWLRIKVVRLMSSVKNLLKDGDKLSFPFDPVVKPVLDSGFLLRGSFTARSIFSESLHTYRKGASS